MILSKIHARQPAAYSSATSAVVPFLVFTEFTSGFLQGYYTPFVASVVQHFRLHDAAANWFSSVFMLSGAVLVPLLSKLGDRFGHRCILRWSVVSVLVAAIVLAGAPNYGTVLIGRGLMGPLAVWLPLEIAIIHSRLTGYSAQRAITLVVAILTGGLVVGALVAGLVAAASMPLWMSLTVPVLLLLVALYVVFRRIPESIVSYSGPIGYAGFAGLGVILCTLILGLAWTVAGGRASVSALVLLGVAIVGVIAWVPWQLRSRAPAIELNVIRLRGVGILLIASLLFGMLIIGNVIPFTTFFSNVPSDSGFGFGFNVTELSILTAGFSLMLVVGSLISAPLAKRFGLRRPLTGACFVAAAAFGGAIPAHGHLIAMVSTMALLWCAAGVVVGLTPALIAESAPSGRTGLLAGLYNTARSVGSAVAGAIFASVLGAVSVQGIGGYLTIWGFSAVGFLVAGVLVVLHGRLAQD